MNSPEINQIKDARLLGEISKLSSQYASFEEFKEALTASLQKTEGLRRSAYRILHSTDTNHLFIPSDAELKAAYEFSRKEHNIVNNAINMVNDTTMSFQPRDTEFNNAMGVNALGQKLAKGPGLMVLDGGPGAGKSFSLKKAMDTMGVPVICLGSTDTAAAALYKDMNDEVNDLKKEKDDKGKPRPQQCQDLGKKLQVFGGLTVDDLLAEEKDIPKDPVLQKRKREVLDYLEHGNPKPCIMVDEAGLLDHDQMAKLMAFIQNKGCKLILAGDAQQIPPNNGQPFKILAESLKETDAYVNAPYVFRQGDFLEKAITSGIYHGYSSDKANFPEGSNEKDQAERLKTASEFMAAALDLGDPKIKYTIHGEEKKFTLRNRLDELYPKLKINENDTDQEKEDKKKEAAERYVSDMKERAKKFTPEMLKSVIQKGLSAGPNGEIDKEQYDDYICAALILQQQGIQAYETTGKIGTQSKDDKELFGNVSKSFEKDPEKKENDYPALKEKAAADLEEKIKKEPELLKDLEEKAKRENKSVDLLKEEMAAANAFAKGHLAITATIEEANELNEEIRKARGNNGILQVGEPILLADGTKRLATQKDVNDATITAKAIEAHQRGEKYKASNKEEAELANNAIKLYEEAQKRGENLPIGVPPGVRFAYALDVKATQGLSQNGLVTMVVTQENADKWRGGEILVGASRHKGKFELQISGQADKAQFFEASTYQYASKRVINSTFNEDLHTAAGGTKVEEGKQHAQEELEKVEKQQRKEFDSKFSENKIRIEIRKNSKKNEKKPEEKKSKNATKLACMLNKFYKQNDISEKKDGNFFQKLNDFNNNINNIVQKTKQDRNNRR